jgi:hypothetical protein
MPSVELRRLFEMIVERVALECESDRHVFMHASCWIITAKRSDWHPPSCSMLVARLKAATRSHPSRASSAQQPPPNPPAHCRN